MLIYLLTLIDNEGDRQTFTAIYGKMNCLEQCRTYQGLWNLRNRMCLAIVH